MARPRKANRDKAFEIYKEYKTLISTKEIAEKLQENISNVNRWRVEDEWDTKLGGIKNKPGGQLGNQNSRKLGWYSKYQPKRVCNILAEIEESKPSELDIMWLEIKTQWALIIDNSKQLHVSSKNDHTKVLKKESSTEFGDTKEYEVITAYEKQLKYTKEISNARKVLFELIEKYIIAVNKDWNLVKEEHKLRVEVLKTKTSNGDDSKEDKIDKYLTAISKEVNSDN